ncbi:MULTISPECIES: hypothetical protein [unclassified Campylobacter]|uniref:hypothetical protein n=1 Tax=unclassified Campylobacter TaxID=2593542 RepID=UPI0022EA06E8|nr:MULTISPECIES: hypothetical protein [unclassified Campylobacter]MDA3043854.1 hypothetical protein [Campylobacter sp. JMF_09 ED2]MDA3044003.1 hypothetical protein [Campylobacter sp. JMF_07 ED4]MDA3064062.1 hypothetical protein [Campylobacter sp. JMF_11 EL3]MDA3072338.1 hypothetical protein [Campylobacter sp. VBCF_03 NA9]MDA3074907.1 hypothetical protein [Campylobacter sp. JMF_05 ED3]
MSIVSFELKKKTILESEASAKKRLIIVVCVVCALAFLILSGGYSLKFKIILGCLIGICGILAHSYFDKNQKQHFSALLDKAFDNEILLWIAKETGLTFKPFGAFFLEDLSSLPIKKDANTCVCKRSLVGKVGEIEAKFGDAALTRANKRKKSLLGLDKFEWGRINDGKIYTGFIAKFDYPLAFASDFSAIGKGEFMLQTPHLKLQKANIAKSDIFDIYAGENFDSEVLKDGKILTTLELISISLNSPVQMHAVSNSVFIAVSNDTLFTRIDTNQNANVILSINMMIEIARNLAPFATNEIKASEEPKITALLNEMRS